MLSFMNVFNAIPGHVFLAHLIPALSIYALGLYYSLRGFYLIKPACGPGNKKGRRAKIGIFMMACGAVYTMFYILQLVGAVISHDEHSAAAAVSRNASLSAMGSCFFLAGATKFVFARSFLWDMSFDLSLPMGLGTLALGTFLYGVFERQPPPPPNNVSFYAFGVFMALSALADLATQTITGKFRSLFGTLLIASAALLTTSSNEIVRWAEKDGSHMGTGTVVVCCLLFASLHALVFALKARHINPFDFDYADVSIPMQPMGAYASMSAPFGEKDRNGGNRGPVPNFSIGDDDDDDDDDLEVAVAADEKKQQQQE